MSHPALLMLKVWAVFGLMYAVLPFQLVDRSLTLHGFVVLFLFIGAFCVGTLTIQPAVRRRAAGAVEHLDLSRSETALAVAGVVTIIAFLIDLRDKSVLDLALAYELRSDQAAALLDGEASNSTLAFQIGFLTYPAGYVYLVRAIVFERRPLLWRLAAFGFLPILMATLAMGGRAPLLYVILIAFLSMSARRIYRSRQDGAQGKARRARLGPIKVIGIVAIIAGALYYFVAVFAARAEVVGGASGMFKVAEEIWGIAFRGPMADAMLQLIGQEWTYLVFIFNWYVVQGLVMSNFLFSDYPGPAQLGVYGVDLVSALVRRIDGALVARYFDALQQLGTYGFLPSAWGSLYVDLWYFGLAASAVWGALATWVYQNVRRARDSRWLVFAPFVTMGILFSFINTPIGFSNGLVTHIWVVVAFLAARQSRARRPRIAPPLAQSLG